MATAWGVSLQRPLNALQNLSTTWLSAELGTHTYLRIQLCFSNTSTEINKIKQTKTMQMQYVHDQRPF